MLAQGAGMICYPCDRNRPNNGSCGGKDLNLRPSGHETVSSISVAFQFKELRPVPWFKTICPSRTDGARWTCRSQTRYANRQKGVGAKWASRDCQAIIRAPSCSCERCSPPAKSCRTAWTNWRHESRQSWRTATPRSPKCFPRFDCLSLLAMLRGDGSASSRTEAPPGLSAFANFNRWSVRSSFCRGPLQIIANGNFGPSAKDRSCN